MVGKSSHSVLVQVGQPVSQWRICFFHGTERIGVHPKRKICESNGIYYYLLEIPIFQSIISPQRATFQEDSLPSSKPIIHTLQYHSDIGSHNYRVTYAKGGVVLNMISKLMGDDKFLQAIRVLHTTGAIKALYRIISESMLTKMWSKTIYSPNWIRSLPLINWVLMGDGWTLPISVINGHCKSDSLLLLWERLI